MRAPSACLLLPLLGACGPQSTEPSTEDFEERCESFELTQLLTLEHDELVPIGRNAISSYKGSWLVGVATLPHTYDGSSSAQLNATHHRLVSVDDCGRRPPKLMAEGLDRTVPPTVEGLPWLGCARTNHDMFIVDPAGLEPPILLGKSPGCLSHEYDDALWIEFELDSGQRDLMRLPASGQPEVIAPNMPRGIYRTVTYGEQYLWFITDVGDLVEYELASGAMKTIATEVETIESSTNDRFITWGTDMDLTYGRWTIFDRQSGQELLVEAEGQPLTQFRTAEFSFIFGGENTTVSIGIPSLEVSEYPGAWKFFTPVGAGDMVAVSHGALYTLRAGVSEPELLYDGGDITGVQLDDGDLYIWEHSDVQAGLDRLIRIPEGSTEAELIIEGVDETLAIDDGRWLSVIASGDEDHGELKMFDPAMGTEEVIDRDVSVRLIIRNPLAASGKATLVIPSDAPFLYTVLDGTSRTGLWRTALAPR